MRTQTSARRSGFTLLELLVVLVVIGIISSFAVLSVGTANRDKPVAKESQRLLALLRLASEEAVLRTEELGLKIDNDSYRFVRYEKNAWQPLEDDMYRERSMPDNITISLVLEGRPIVLEDPAQNADNAKTDDQDKTDNKSPPKPPQIMLLSSGEVSPFTLTLSDHPGDAQHVITSTGDGHFVLDSPADATGKGK